MAVHKIKQGLDLPILGEPEQSVEAARRPGRVALVATDYHGMKPTMHVEVGDVVRRGQLLFEDKKTPGVRYTSPAGGKVVGIHRGAKRALQSVVIELGDDEKAGKAESVDFDAFSGKDPQDLSGDDVRALLLESGLWTAMRARPFDKVADPATTPSSVFVTAADSSPLAPDPKVVMAGHEEDFQRGLVALSKLTEGNVYICTDETLSLALPTGARFKHEQFAGPHPSGTAGFHIHTLDPVNRAKTVWHIDYQDVLLVGKLFLSGKLDVRRVVALAGPPVERPRLLETRIGASVDDLAEGEHSAADARIISGCVFTGRACSGEESGYLSRYSHHVSILTEDHEREFLGWLGAGFKKFSVLGTYLSSLIPNQKYAFTTTTHGSERAIVPVGMHEKVFPFDILPTYLLRALAVGDIEHAEALGALELAEDDVALLSFVCASKNDYGALLRDVLTTIEKEG